MKKIIVLFILFTIQVSFSQSLTVSELINIYENKNVEQLNNFFSQKNWSFENAKENYPRENFNYIQWRFNVNNNNVAGFFSVVVHNNKIKIIHYNIYDSTFNYFKQSLDSNGFNMVNSTIKDGAIISIYTNGKYEVSVKTSKITDGNKSGTNYFITLMNEYYGSR